MNIDFGTRIVASRGGSLQITLPATFVKTFKIKKGATMHVTSNGEKLILEVEKR
jgi:antitoxin component of MazEF toxin-antitoxin module